MSQAIVDPQELRRFASDLKAFNSGLRDNMTRMHAQLRRLGESWRDQEHKRFAQEFEQAVKLLNHFMGESDKYIQFLQRKAEPIEEYLKRR